MFLLLAVVVSTAGCNSTKAPDMAVAAAPAAPTLPPFQQEIASVKAELTLPGVWKFGYRMVDHADTAYGAYRAIEFHYTADSAQGVPPRLLMVVRVFHKAAWEKTQATHKDMHRLLAEHGNDVYGYSIVGQSPYPNNSPSTLRVDQMMLALMADGSPFKISFK